MNCDLSKFDPPKAEPDGLTKKLFGLKRNDILAKRFGIPMEKEVQQSMDKEGFIKDITRKLCGDTPLNPNEIQTIIRALRESTHCFQEPYYEVIYHDKFDNTETRIMNPIDSRIIEGPSGEIIQTDHFDLRFNRILRKSDVELWP